jgi:hypothetical protein
MSEQGQQPATAVPAPEPELTPEQVAERQAQEEVRAFGC